MPSGCFIDKGPLPRSGALQDPIVAAHDEQVVLNVGNTHTLAFYPSGTHVHAFFEHHTDRLNSGQLESMAEQLADGTLSHEAVFAGQGHGVFYADRSMARRRLSPSRVRSAASCAAAG